MRRDVPAGTLLQIDGILWDKALKAGRAVTLIGAVSSGPGTPPDLPPDLPPMPGEPPTEGVKPPPPGGGWGYHPEYGLGYFPGGGGKPQPPGSG